MSRSERIGDHGRCRKSSPRMAPRRMRPTCARVYSSCQSRTQCRKRIVGRRIRASGTIKRQEGINMKFAAFRRTRLAVAVSAAALSLAAGQAFGSNFALQEQSGSGVGNAFAGGAAAAEDASTICSNPAGMSRLPGIQGRGRRRRDLPVGEVQQQRLSAGSVAAARRQRRRCRSRARLFPACIWWYRSTSNWRSAWGSVRRLA